MNSLNCVQLSLPAMATRFELVLYGSASANRLRSIGEEALEEISRLEAQLSFYQPASEISWLNAHAADAPQKVEPRLFRTIQRCAELTSLTDGAFDITVGPLMRAWRLVSGAGLVPTPERLDAARAVTGARHLEFDEDPLTIRYQKPGVELDLGGYGKGYAIEQAMRVLREHRIESALLHGGTSSVATIGHPPDAAGWHIGLDASFQEGEARPSLLLRDESLSVSAVHGKYFETNGRRYGHVLDPRSGVPVGETLAAAVTGPSAADCEALSTALLVLGSSWESQMQQRFPAYRCLIVNQDGSHTNVNAIDHTINEEVKNHACQWNHWKQPAGNAQSGTGLN